MVISPFPVERRKRSAFQDAPRSVSVLAAASIRLAESLEWDETLEAIGRLVVPLLSDICVVDVVADDGPAQRFAVYEGEPGPAALLSKWPVDVHSDNPIALVLRERRVWVQRITTELVKPFARDEAHLETMLSFVGRTALCVPMVRGDRVLGSLFMTTRDDSSTFNADDIELAEALGRRAAVALDNARRFRVEHDVATTLQRSLLPQSLPETPGVQHCARYLPAATEAEVGGDWYDVIALADGSVAFVVGDVAGKGVQAAAVMGQLRASVRAYIWEGHQPAEVLHRLDQLFGALDLSDFTTAAVGIYDPATRLMTYSVAGHPPILLVSPTCGTRYLASGTGTPLGVTTGEFSNDSLVLEQGTTLVLYTDGLIERRGESLDAGLERLRDVAGAEYDGLEQMSDAIVGQLIPSSGAPDDVALLLVHTA